MVAAGALANVCALRVATIQAYAPKTVRTVDDIDWDSVATGVAKAVAMDPRPDIVLMGEAAFFGWLNPAVFTEAPPVPGLITDRMGEIACLLYTSPSPRDRG